MPEGAPEIGESSRQRVARRRTSKQPRKVAMLSLYSAVSGFATMPPQSGGCFCAPPTPMPPHMCPSATAFATRSIAPMVSAQ